MARGFLARTLSAVTLMVVAPLWFCATASAQPPVRTVLAIHWSSEDFPTTPIVDAAIRDVFRSRVDARIDYYAEYLESDRFPEDEALSTLRDYMRSKYRDRRIDVVLAISEAALQFVLRYRAELFPDAPVVASVQTVRPPDIRRAGAGLTGVVGGFSDAETLELALKLHQSTERVFVIAQGATGQVMESARTQLAPFAQRVELTFLGERSLPRLIAAVKAVPARSVILFIRHSQEEPGSVVFPDEVARLVAAAAPVPMYGINDLYIGSGVVGGVVRITRLTGTRVGEIALRILDGTRAEDIPMEQVPSVSAFDWRQVQRWGIDASQLPPGSDIRFRVPTAWEMYRWYIVGTIALVALQGLMIAGLVIQRSRRREVEARNSAVLRAMPDTMFLLTRDGVYVDCHAADGSRLLAEPGHFIGRHMREVLPPELAAAFEARFARLTPGEPPALLEYALQMPEGECQFEARIVPCRDDQVLAVVQDVTERKRGEAALSESRERYSRATAAGGVGVWDWDLETNEMYVDPLLKAILGYEDHDIRNHFDDWSRLVHPADAPVVMERVRAHLAGQSGQYEVEHRMVHRDGSIRWFLARGSAVRGDGRAVRVIGTDTDISERKHAEQALLEAQADLSRVSRLTALGEFAASIAHEVRQPLTAIIANARTCLRWLASATPDVAEVRAALLDVVDSGRRADDIIQRNRELFRHHAVEKAPLDINSVITEATALARSRLQASHVALTIPRTVDLPMVMGDRVGLQQVLLNLIANSIDAMESVDALARHVDVSTSVVADGMVAVSVKDTGIGLDGVDLQRMFALSYTTKATGSGVGLSVSRSIVEAHGGRLWAEQNADRGATFSFTVPVHPTVAAV